MQETIRSVVLAYVEGADRAAREKRLTNGDHFEDNQGVKGSETARNLLLGRPLLVRPRRKTAPPTGPSARFFVWARSAF
jgi:hypothetical protein